MVTIITQNNINIKCLFMNKNVLYETNLEKYRDLQLCLIDSKSYTYLI